MAVFLPIDPFQDGDLVPDYSSAKRRDAATELAKQDTFTATQGLDFWGAFDGDYAFGRDDLLDRLEKNDRMGPMAPEELNERFPFVEVPFAKPASFLVADHLNREGKKRRELMDIISNGGTASSASTLGYSLLGGLIASATDPVEAAADLLITAVTAGLGTVAAKAAKGARLVRNAKAFNRLNKARKILKGTKVGLGGRFIKESAEGVAVNAAIEPILMNSSQRAQQDYDEFDATVSIMGGGIGLPAMKNGTIGLGRYIKNNTPRMRKAISTAVSHVKAGKRFSDVLNYISETTKAKINGVDRTKLEAGSIRERYQIKRLSPNEIKKTKFYMAGLRPGKYNPESHHIVGEYYGDGVHITDNPNVANNITQLPENANRGNVHEVNLSDSNLLDLDNPTKSDVGDTVRTKVPEELRADFDEGNTLKRSLDNIKERLSRDNGDIEDAELFNGINSTMKELGFDGYRYHEGDSGNYAFFFDKEKLSLSESFKGDPTTIPRNAVELDAEIRAKVADPSSDIGHKAYIEEEKVKMENWQKSKQKIRDSVPEDNQARLDQIMNDFTELKDSGIYPDDLRQELGSIGTGRQIDELEDDYMKMIIECRRLGGKA